MERISKSIFVSIDEEIPDLVAYQPFLHIVFRLPEANEKNMVAFREPFFEKKEGASYTIHGMRDENVHDFIKRYIPDFSIRYYTCESFIFTSINNAFQLSKNFDSLIRHRMIVTDLRNMLKTKPGGIVFDNSTNTGPFYKAEIMSQDKLRFCYVRLFDE